MSRTGWLFLAFAVAAGGAVAAVPRPPASAGIRAAVALVPTDDPFPIRRVRGSDSRLPDLLKELEAGPVVRLPRSEFEARVRTAGRAVFVAKQAARVVSATYTAELDGTDLVGTAEIGILNASGVTGFVPLDPLRLAVRSAKWADGAPALVTVPLGEPAPAVWADRDGRQLLRLGWSVAGTTEPGERRFDLRVPACATSSLELVLPADQVPTASADVLLTGPFDTPGQPARRAWRLRFGGRSRLEFAVRTAGAPNGASLAKLAATYDLAAGQLTAAFVYDLHPARGSAGEWAFVADPGLRITDVATNNRAGWTVDPPVVPGGPRQVRVSLRQPGPGGKVLVTAVAPFPDPARPDAPLPVVRPLNAVIDEEKIDLRVAPGLKVESWAPGDYRLTDAVAPTPLFPFGPGEQSRVLALVGTLLPAGSNEAFRRMPVVRTAPAEADFTTLERLEWAIDPTRTVLIARVSVRVRHGPLFQIAVRPPPGFVVDRSVTGADETVSHVGPLVAGHQVVEFARPLASGQQADLRLEFRGPGAPLGAPVPFPAFAVAGAAERDGWLSVTAAPTWGVVARAGAGAIHGGLWGWLTTDSSPDARAVYLFRGKEPDGTATLTAARPQVNADALVRLDTVAGQWVATMRFTLAVTGGVWPTAAVFVPGPPAARVWKLLDETNAITEAAPVPRELLQSAPLFVPLDARAAVLGACARAGPEGTVWVLRFARPLAGEAVLETTAAGPPVGATAAALPVPQLLGAKQATRAVAAPAIADATAAQLAGDFVRPEPLPPRNDGPDAGTVQDAYLVTAVRAPGETLAAFGGTVRDTRGGALRIVLPPDTGVRGVCVAGRWLNPSACAERDSEGAIRVPIPAGPAVRFEVRYRLTVPPGWPTRRIVSPVPEVSGGAPPAARWWAFAPGALPNSFLPWGQADQPLPLLGGPLISDPGALTVFVTDQSHVSVGTVRTADALSCALAAGWVVFGLLAVRRRARWTAGLAAAVVLNLAVAELGPPWWARAAWPPLLAVTVAFGAVLAALAVRSRAAVPAAVSVCMFVLVCRSYAAVAQSAVPVTVLILPGANGTEEVVLARAVLARLNALAHPQPPAAVVTAAEYDVQADEAGAQVTAKFAVHAFRSGDNTVVLPLGDVRLERATVDGAAALPTAARADVYTLTVGGPGRHEVELRFAATVTATGPEREVRFGAPEVPEARVAATLPGAARLPQVVGRAGRQIVSAGDDRARVSADLGPARTVHLRWREAAAGTAVVKVREGCVWDVTEAGADLTCAYLVRIEQGTIVGLRYEIPAELEVLRITVRTTDAPAGPVPLRDWALEPEKDGFRLLRVDFQSPAAGRLLAVLECAPRKPLSRQPVLRFPRVRFGTVTGESEAVYGLRAARGMVDGVGLSGVIDFPSDALKDFLTVPDLKFDANKPVRAFRPAAGATGELRPHLHVGELAAARTVTAWCVGPHRADATGTVAWTAKDPLPLVEFALDGVKMLEVRGPEVVGWGQSSGRVQVWLRAGTREGVIEWAGTVEPGKAPDPLPFDPVHPKVLNARVLADEVRVKPADGWALRPDRSRGWQTMTAPAGELRFHTDQPGAPPLHVLLTPGR